jgi:lipoyl(octanoyl) transferase
MFPCRVFVDPPADGAWNMAVDEALLEQAADEGVASLRFYQWREPTLSLGYFQRYAERDQHAASRGAAVVRRLSGGGALLHDRELTYSIALPAGHAMARRSPELYAAVHQVLIEVLAARGVVAHLHGDDASQHIHHKSSGTADAPRDEPFLCFARRTDADVVIHTSSAQTHAKIAGSAQRRRRGAVLQHGGVLLAASPCAPELPGIAQSGVKALNAFDLIEPWSAALAARLNLQLAKALSATVESCPRCNDLANKYASPTWTRRR